MGLDIVVRRNVKKVDSELLEGFNPDDDLYEQCRAKGWFTVWDTDTFPVQSEGIEVDTPYSCDPGDVSFRAGSYGSYNRWRDELAVLAGFESADEVWNMCKSCIPADVPFIEIINFSDCEGVIGPKVCRKLAKDFENFADSAVGHTCKFVEEDYFRELYFEFKEALEYAGDNGVLVYC